jgi:hypothetical protein
MKCRVQNSEVLYADEQVTSADKSDIDWLKKMSATNPRQRIRLCTHDGLGKH